MTDAAIVGKSFKHDTRAAMRGRLHGVGLRRSRYLRSTGKSKQR
jgi:hypothetical protein